MEVVHGNRGLCAGPCRLPYTLINNKNEELNKGNLLSPRDLMGAHYLPSLIKSGVKCFKIEGRLKNPEYVGIVTKYYRNLIDLIYNNIDKSDSELLKIITEKENEINPITNMTCIEELTQSFNRGGFSDGHFSRNPNKELVYKEFAGNTGFYLGKVEKYNSSKGYITLKLNHSIGIGDKISIASEIYTISELMKHNNNIRTSFSGDIVTIGRIKGNIKHNQKIYKIQSKALNNYISPTFSDNKEFKKIKLNTTINIKNNEKISIKVTGVTNNSIYYNETAIVELDTFPTIANNSPITKDVIISQISKTGNTPFVFEKIIINLDNNLFVPIKTLNDLRRNALDKLQKIIIEKHINSKRLNLNIKKSKNIFYSKGTKNTISNPFWDNPSINLLLTILDENKNYTDYLKGVNKLYIPLKYFMIKKYNNQLNILTKNYNTYIYMPNILKDNFIINFDKILELFTIKGFVISSLSQINILKNYNLELIGNYNLNVYNKYTLQVLKDFGLNSLCITPELSDNDTIDLINNFYLPTELFVYGNIPLMTMNYCLLGNSNKCYKECNRYCEKKQKYYIKDRLAYKFRIIPDNFLNITKIYNSKTTSFDYSKFNTKQLRIHILDESPEEIYKIISNVKKNIPFKGNQYCGHFNKN